jgi:hypothetical protein
MQVERQVGRQVERQVQCRLKGRLNAGSIQVERQFGIQV